MESLTIRQLLRVHSDHDLVQFGINRVRTNIASAMREDSESFMVGKEP